MVLTNYTSQSEAGWDGRQEEVKRKRDMANLNAVWYNEGGKGGVKL